MISLQAFARPVGLSLIQNVLKELLIDAYASAIFLPPDGHKVVTVDDATQLPGKGCPLP